MVPAAGDESKIGLLAIGWGDVDREDDADDGTAKVEMDAGIGILFVAG